MNAHRMLAILNGIMATLDVFREELAREVERGAPGAARTGEGPKAPAFFGRPRESGNDGNAGALERLHAAAKADAPRQE